MLESIRGPPLRVVECINFMLTVLYIPLEKSGGNFKNPKNLNQKILNLEKMLENRWYLDSLIQARNKELLILRNIILSEFSGDFKDAANKEKELINKEIERLKRRLEKS